MQTRSRASNGNPLKCWDWSENYFYAILAVKIYFTDYIVTSYEITSVFE